MQPAEPGRILAERYRLSEVIGRGGMGVVWRARDELLSRDVAVKEMVWPPYFTDAEQQAACRRATWEAQAAARLNHPNVICIYDIVQEDGCPWIVMELVPYRSLRDVVAEHGPLTPGQAARVGLGVLAALRAAHSKGIVHRDVKPANILIGGQGERVVLTDFGIAYAADGPAVTTTGALIGSPSYIAPERARGEQSGPAGDLWALGASLYAAVEGRPPFDRVNALASLTAIVADEPAPATKAGTLWPVISGLLRKDPDKRLDAAVAERMLRRVTDAPPHSAGHVSPRHRRSHGSLPTMAGSVALAVLAASSTAAGLALTRSAQHETAVSAAVITAPRPEAAAAHPAAAAGTDLSTLTTSHLTARRSPAKTHRHSHSKPASAGSETGH